MKKPRIGSQRAKYERRINYQIRTSEVRLIDADGNQLGVVSIPEALQRAQSVGLDLVEISPTAVPPVCKILDYGKYKYEAKKKEQESKKKQAVIKLKEIKMRPVTDVHDLAFKLKNARSFLEEGDKVKLTVVFRGREMAFREGGFSVLNKMSEGLADLAKIEQEAKQEGKSLTMVLTPAK